MSRMLIYCCWVYGQIGPRTKDCQVATFGDNHTQTLSSVACQVGGLDWNMSHHDSFNVTRRFVPVDQVIKSVRFFN